MATENPYVGPQPFTNKQLLFGRDREVNELRYLLISERVILLYSASGAGKSSLIQAGLIPSLEDRFDIWGHIRVNTKPPDGFQGNRYVYSTLASLGQSGDVSADLTLADYAQTRRSASDANRRNPLLIFDQFEEVLSVDTGEPSANAEAKTVFFKQVAALLRDPNIWALFVLREEYLAPLDPYAHQLPTHLKNRFRLTRLDRRAAKEAIEGPAKGNPRQYGEGVVDKLVDNLADQDNYVEPIQLQVVCFDLWQRLESEQPPRMMVAETDIVRDKVSDAMGNYYDDAVKRAVKLAEGKEDLLLERSIREWFQNELLTKELIRTQVLREQPSSGTLQTSVAEHLRNLYIVRLEPRAGADWYELSHDRLSQPVRRSNEAWFAAMLLPWQKQAKLWLESDKPAALLLRGKALRDAKKRSDKKHPQLRQTEHEFLIASTVRQKQLWMIIGAVSIIALVLAVLGGWIWRQKEQLQEKNEELRAKESKQIALIMQVLMRPLVRASIEGGSVYGTIEVDGRWKQYSANGHTLVAASMPRDGGRLLVAAHDDVLFHTEELGAPFLEMALSWLQGDRKQKTIRIVTISNSRNSQSHNMLQFKQNLHYLAKRYHYRFDSDFALEKNGGHPLSPESLKDVAVLIIANRWTPNFKDEELDAIDEFRKRGGGVLAVGLGWSWVGYGGGPNKTVPIEEYPLNKLMSRYGAKWTKDTLSAEDAYQAIGLSGSFDIHNTFDEAVDVYWINYNGEETHYGRVERGGEMHLVSYLHHKWVLRRATNHEVVLRTEIMSFPWGIPPKPPR